MCSAMHKQQHTHRHKQVESHIYMHTHTLTHTQSDNDELNKTLPSNFRFSTSRSTLHPNMQSPPTRISPIRSHASSTRQRATSIQRRQPVAPNQKPDLFKYKGKPKAHMGKSDPAIARHVSRQSYMLMCHAISTLFVSYHRDY